MSRVWHVAAPVMVGFGRRGSAVDRRIIGRLNLERLAVAVRGGGGCLTASATCGYPNSTP
jgi:hypothetical protein